jgi:GTPase SAR1 family protein
MKEEFYMNTKVNIQTKRIIQFQKIQKNKEVKFMKRIQKLFLSFLLIFSFVYLFPMNVNAAHYFVKVVVVGNFESGKTSILNCFTGISNKTAKGHNTYKMSYVIKSINNHNGNDYTLHLWDTAGEEKYYSLQPQYFRKTDIAIVVVSLEDQDYITLDKTNHHNALWDAAVMKEYVERWFDDVRAKANPNCQFILVGSKIDLANDPNDLASKRQALQSFADQNGAQYVEVACNNNANVMSLRQNLDNQIKVALSALNKIPKDTHVPEPVVNLAAEYKEAHKWDCC